MIPIIIGPRGHPTALSRGQALLKQSVIAARKIVLDLPKSDTIVSVS